MVVNHYVVNAVAGERTRATRTETDGTRPAQHIPVSNQNVTQARDDFENPYFEAAKGFWDGFKAGGLRLLSKVPGFSELEDEADRAFEEAGIAGTWADTISDVAGDVSVAAVEQLLTGPGANVAKLRKLYNALEKVEQFQQLAQAAQNGDQDAARILLQLVAGAAQARKARVNQGITPDAPSPNRANKTLSGPALANVPDAVPRRAKPGNSDSSHGNSLDSPRPAQLYRLEDSKGNFLKWGVTQDVNKRYPKSYLENKHIRPQATGTRREMIELERRLVETQPGPLNRERWAGRRLGEQP